MHEFVGRWRITWMKTWDQNYVNLIEPGYFEFTADGLGEFLFGAVRGWMDVRVDSRTPYLEYSWQGECEGDDYCGRGWFEYPTPNKGEGKIFIHCGDESELTIERET
jgi:hypothetical protein